MSALIFFTDEENAVVATDTLGVNPEGEPFQFSSKAVHLPHLNLIVAGTGLGGFATEWAFKLNDKLIVSGLNNLDYHTPRCLRELWAKFKDELKFGDAMTTTVYHFGLSQIDRNVTAFAYRSANNFESEQLAYGLRAKPECDFPEESCSIMDAIPVMMRDQRRIQDATPKANRLYIGGDIQVLHLTRDGCRSFKLGEFSDREDTQRLIFENFK